MKNDFKRRLLIAAVILLGAAIPVLAHVGSPDVFYEGDAGPYHLFVTVRMPQVIPGVAEIQVRCENGDVNSVQIVPLRLNGPGSNLPPTPDLAKVSKDDPQFFTGSLWLMESGALQVRVMVDGAKGKGELSVPVASFAQRTFPMEKPLAGLMVVMLFILGIGVISIAGAGAREASLERGEAPGPSNARRARIVMVVTVIVVVGLLYLGKSWWGLEDSDYQGRVNFYKPPTAETTLENGNRLVIRARGQNPKWSDRINMGEVVPDHNHLMHLFLIELPGMNRMWHLHPSLAKGGAFTDDLPNMPAGHYQVFADVVDSRGFPWTLVGTVDFSVQDKDGKPAQDLEPYMGMAGHAEFVRSDLSVFAHVHPAGSMPMASLEMAQAGLMGDASSMQGMMAMAPASGTMSSEVSFPYGFPKPGDYRIFVQVKRAGKVETGVFDASVQ